MLTGGSLIETLIIVVLSNAGVVGVMWKLVLPHIVKSLKPELQCADHEHRLQTLEEGVRDLHDKKVKDYAAIIGLTDKGKIIVKTLFALLDHAKTNNETEKMAAAELELRNFIINN